MKNPDIVAIPAKTFKPERNDLVTYILNFFYLIYLNIGLAPDFDFILAAQ